MYLAPPNGHALEAIYTLIPRWMAGNSGIARLERINPHLPDMQIVESRPSEVEILFIELSKHLRIRPGMKSNSHLLNALHALVIHTEGNIILIINTRHEGYINLRNIIVLGLQWSWTIIHVYICYVPCRPLLNAEYFFQSISKEMHSTEQQCALQTTFT